MVAGCYILRTFALIVTCSVIAAKSEFFPTPSLLPLSLTKNLSIAPTSEAAENSWFIVRGLHCVGRETDSFGLSPDEKRDVAISESACIWVCAKQRQCRIAEWIDFSKLSYTGNQRYCKLYSNYSSCFATQAKYYEKNQEGSFLGGVQNGKYCASMAGSHLPSYRPVYYSNATEYTRLPTPGYTSCHNECLGINGTNGKPCSGFNYLPQEMPLYMSTQVTVTPCLMFFTEKCTKMLEARLFYKAFNLTMLNEAREALANITFITDNDYTMAKVEYLFPPTTTSTIHTETATSETSETSLSANTTMSTEGPIILSSQTAKVNTSNADPKTQNNAASSISKLQAVNIIAISLHFAVLLHFREYSK